LSETLLIPDVENAEAMIMELDELWSFVSEKDNQAWIWIALCRKTRQVIAYARRVIEVKKHVKNYGNLFPKLIVLDTVTVIFGVHIRQ